MMLQTDDIQQELMATFQPELEEHLETLNKGLLALEQGPEEGMRIDLLSTVFRSAHSIKGAARAVGLEDIEAVAHKMEDALGQVRKHKSPLLPTHVDALLASVDAIRDIMEAHLRTETYEPAKINALFARLDVVTHEVENEIASQASPGEPPASAATVPASHLPSVHAAPVTESKRETSPFESDIFDPIPNTVKPDISTRFTPTEDSGDSIPARAVAKVGTVILTSETDRTAIPYTPPVPQSPAAGVNAGGSAPDDTRSVRVATSKLDTLMDNMGELLVARMRLGQIVEQVRQLQTRTATLQKDQRKVRTQVSRLRRVEAFAPSADNTSDDNVGGADSRPEATAQLSKVLTADDHEIKTLKAEIDLLMQRVSSDHNHLQIVTSDMQDSIRNMRMLPIATLFDFFPRMVRDLARERGKEVFLQTEGVNTEVDRQALELLKDPLTHLVRNAVDHGIEAPTQRDAAGKAPHGILRLRAEQRGDRLVLEVSDDGRGIDVRELRTAVVERGMLSLQDATALSDEEALELIFRSGMSTTRKVNSISGRGIGMDVVRQNIEQLRGVIQVHTEVGKGTSFIMTLPLTLATSDVLLVQTADQVVALPLMNIDRIMRIDASQVGAIEGKPAIHLDGRLLPLVYLSHLLELSGPAPAPEARFPVVIIGLADRHMAVRVDGLLSTQEVVIKPMGRQVRRVRNIAGAAVLGNGQVVLILNMTDLMKTMQSRSAVAALAPSIPNPITHKVLIVDDSITTRTLVKHILRNAGYDVLTATDGLEAWEMVRSNEGSLPDVIVSDVNMPNMDGFTLTETLKSDPLYRHLPVILVTSLDSQADRVRGMEAGADTYIVKGSFDQRELLEAIERLIG